MFTLNQMACLENPREITYTLKPFLQEIQPLLPQFQGLSCKGSAYNPVPTCMLNIWGTTPVDGGALREKEVESRCPRLKLQSTKPCLALQRIKKSTVTDLFPSKVH